MVSLGRQRSRVASCSAAEYRHVQPTTLAANTDHHALVTCSEGSELRRPSTSIWPGCATAISRAARLGTDPK